MATTIASASTTPVRAPDAPSVNTGFRVSCDSFADGATIPMEHVFSGAGGQNRSPALTWTSAPTGTKSFAVTCFDPDAPTGSGYWHWVAFGIPAVATGLESAVGGRLPAIGGTGINDFGLNEYDGPAPPKGDGPHRYVFTVYALAVESVGGSAKTTGATLVFSMRGHVLATASITGTFGH